MAPPIPKHWTTDPEYIDLLNYLIRKAKDVESPMRIKRLAIEFKEKSGAAQPVNSLYKRIESLRKLIHSFEHIDTNTKVKLMFALSASVDANVLKRMKKEEIVEVDDKKRIIHFKAIDGSLELRGNHSPSAKIKTALLESKGSIRSMITSYFQKKNDVDAVPKNKEEKEMGNLIDFVSEKCINVDTPLSICQLAKDFKNRFGISVPFKTICTRIIGYCREIQKTEFLDTQTEVQQLFSLSATVDSDCLKELRKNAQIEVDEKNRITHYKATNGSLELRGDHSFSAKCRTGKLESKKSIRSLIINYFETKDDADTISQNEEKKEMGNLIEFITEKCVDVDKPLNICRLAKEFKIRFGISVPLETIRTRVRGYCREIQEVEFLDTHTKIKQLFGLSAKVNSDYLEKLRKDAFVEVDNRNRITKYTANDSSLTLHGDPSQSAKNKLKDDSDEYSSEDFDSEFDSDDESDQVDSLNEVLCFDNETPIRNRSASEMSIDDNNFDIDPLIESSQRSEETERSEDEENDLETTGNALVKTRSERLSKRRHLNSEVSYNRANSSNSEGPMNTDSLSPKSAKQKKQGSRSSNQSRSSSRSMRRSTRNSSFPPTSTDLEENMEYQDAQRAVEEKTFRFKLFKQFGEF
ncbi:unnamed protein product [Caenorhabditis brenneri]